VAEMGLGARDDAPDLAPLPCAVFERHEQGFCVDADDRSARLRALLDRSARALVFDAGPPRAFLAPAGRVDVTLPLTPECPSSITIELVMLDGDSLRWSFEL